MPTLVNGWASGMPVISCRGLGLGSMALLVFLAGATGALVVAAHFFACPAGASAVAASTCTGGAGLIEFALLLFLKLALESIDSGRWSAGGNRNRSMLTGWSCLLRMSRGRRARR